MLPNSYKGRRFHVSGDPRTVVEVCIMQIFLPVLFPCRARNKRLKTGKVCFRQLPFSQERNSPSKSENVRQSFEKVSNYARATFCNHRESPDNFNFFESLISSPKIAFDELFLKPILETSGNIYFFENFRKSDRAAEVPIFECKLCTKAQHRRILQKSPIRFRLLTKPSLSFFYMWHMKNYPYLSNWPFLTAFNYHWE